MRKNFFLSLRLRINQRLLFFLEFRFARFHFSVFLELLIVRSVVDIELSGKGTRLDYSASVTPEDNSLLYRGQVKELLGVSLDSG